MVLLGVRFVLEFLEQFLRDLVLPLGLLVIVRWVHHSDNSKAHARASQRRPFVAIACYSPGKKRNRAMNAKYRTLVPSILSTEPDAIEPENQALELAVSDEPKASAVRVKRLLYTQKEAAECLGACRSTLWRLTKEGIFHPIELRPGTWRYQIAEIEAFAREGRRPKDLRNARPQPRKAGV